MAIDLIAYLAGVFGMVSFLPQIYKSIRIGRMDDISWLMLWATFASVALYEIYAVMLALVPVIIMNGIFLASVCVTLLLKMRLKTAQA